MVPLFLKSLLPNRPVPLPILSGPFQGAMIHLNPRSSLRKVCGVYEYQLNTWLKEVLPSRVSVFDVGANDGYFTYGCAKAIKLYHQKAYIIAFDPAMDEHPALQISATSSRYTGIDFEFLSLYVGANSDYQTITLNQAYQERLFLHDKPSLIKVDVEGAEIEVLRGASLLLEEPHHWVVEVHGDHLLEPVIEFFTEAKRPVNVYPPQPHWLLGPEARPIKTSWVTTKLD